MSESYEQWRERLERVRREKGPEAALTLAEERRRELNEPELDRDRGELLNESQRWSDAIGVLEPLITRWPDPDARYHLAVALSMAGREPEAREHALAISRDAESRPEYKILLADLQARNGNVDEAIRLLREAVATNPDSVNAASALAYHLVGVEQPEEAEKLARKVLELDPEHETALAALGMSLVGLGKEPDAVPYLRRAFEITRTNPVWGFLLSGALIGTGELEEASRVAQESLERWGERPLLLERAAAIASALGNHGEALRLARRAVEMDPQWPDGWARLAMVLNRAGRRPESREALKQGFEYGSVSEPLEVELREEGLFPDVPR
jgi:Flp pilus assembly protein TadD